MAGRSRMNREVHVRICESLGVKFPRATRPSVESGQTKDHFFLSHIDIEANMVG